MWPTIVKTKGWRNFTYPLSAPAIAWWASWNASVIYAFAFICDYIVHRSFVWENRIIWKEYIYGYCSTLLGESWNCKWKEKLACPSLWIMTRITRGMRSRSPFYRFFSSPFSLLDIKFQFLLLLNTAKHSCLI